MRSVSNSSVVLLSKKSGKFEKICKMSDQSCYLVSKRSRRMLGRHASSLRGNFKMNFHIGGFFAKLLIFAQQYTSGKTQLFPSKFGLLRFCWEGSFNVRIWSASWSMTLSHSVPFRFNKKFNLFFSFKQTNKSAQSGICFLSFTKVWFFGYYIGSVLGWILLRLPYCAPIFKSGAWWCWSFL